MTETNSFTLPRADAALVADVILSACSTDDITPVICGGQLAVADGKLTVVATDRYRVHTASIDLTESSGDHSFIIPRAVVAWMKRNLTVFGRNQIEQQVVTFSHVEDGALTVVIADPLSEQSVTWTGKATRGNFPPVLRLFAEARDAESSALPARLRLDFLGKASVLGDRYNAPVVKFTKTSNPNKPGVVYIAFTGDDKHGKSYVRAEALVQPNLLPA